MSRRKRRNEISFRYKVIMTFGIIAALIPITAYAVLITVLDVQSSGLMLLGLIGSIAIIIPIAGLSMVVARFADGKKMRQEDRKSLKFSVIFLLVCLLFIAICLIFSLTPEIYSEINESLLSFYAFGILVIAMFGAFYRFFSRRAIDNRFRRYGLSKSTINKLKKGTKNYWWYEALNKECGMGILYPCNKYFTLSFFIGSAIHIVLGWLSPFVLVSAFLFWIMGLTLSVLMVYVSWDHPRTVVGMVGFPLNILVACCVLTWFALNV